jgi:APA family basic amino acid/polyamine antiporter
MFANWIFFALVISSVFLVRRRSSSERVYHAWGYPVVPIIFLLTTAWLLTFTFITAPKRSLIGLGLVALGLPVFYYRSRKNRRFQ